MEWIVAPAIGLMLSSIVAYNIYAYRSLVIYDARSISKYLTQPNGELNINDAYTGIPLTFTLLTIGNHGFKNVRDFVLSTQESFTLLNFNVADTTSINAGSISVKEEQGHLTVACPYLPKGEKIEVELVTDRKPSFWKVRGQGDQYRLESHAFLEGYRKAISVLLWIISIGLIASLTGALIGTVVAKS